MGLFSPIHWLICAIELVIFIAGVIASTRILKRMGFSPWRVLLGFVPSANVYGLWRCRRWPGWARPIRLSPRTKPSGS
jgi:hypothetical protein